MKKNTMMRIASFLLIAVLLSTSAISGTYAKYVTKASGYDTARVAKFGVEVAVTGSLFSQTYVEVADGNIPGSSDLTVKSSDADKLVAPGTQNDAGLTFSIKGTPEVKVDVDITIDDTSLRDVYLLAGDYLNYTTGNNITDTFNLASTYNPLIFTLKDGNGNVINSLEDVNISTIESYLENTLSKEYEALTVLDTIVPGNDGTYTLTWKWNFENGVDEADTLLGNIAADAATYGVGLDGKYNLNTYIDLSITVTQVD